MRLVLQLLSGITCLCVAPIALCFGCSAQPAKGGKMPPPWQPRPLATLDPIVEGVRCLAFSPSGDHLVMGSDPMLRVWDFHNAGPPVSHTEHQNTIYAVAFSPDGKFLVSGSWDKTIYVWDSQTWSRVASLSSPDGKGVLCLAISPDSRRLASGSFGGEITLWDLRPFRRTGTLRGHTESVNGLAFSSDGRLLMSVSRDITAAIWDVSTQARVAECRGHRLGMYCLALSPNGKWLTTGDADGTVFIWEVPEGKKVATLVGHRGGVNCLMFSPCGSYLFVGYDAAVKLPGHVAVWSTRTFDRLLTIQCHERGTVKSLCMSADGKFAATASAGRAVRVWDFTEWMKHITDLDAR